jgi:hypothetical protein
MCVDRRADESHRRDRQGRHDQEPATQALINESSHPFLQ